MKYIIHFNLKIAFVLIFVVSSSFAQSQTNNSISGFIFDAGSRTPVPDVYVELLNEVYTTLKRVRTDGSGRYFFAGMSAGNFKVKVLPYGTNYLEEVQDTTVINQRIGNAVISDSVYLDIYLRLDKRKINILDLHPSGTVFVQDIPSTAKNLYKKGISQFENEKEEIKGFENLKKAIEIFPDYYDALDRIGIEYVKRKQYFEAVPYLIKSISVNQRSFSSFYVLGLAAYNLKQITEAVDAFKATTIIDPKSAHAHLQYGMVLRINGNFKESEQTLLKAHSLSKDSLTGLIHWQLALLYDKLERYNEAADELEKYLKFQSNVENTEQVKKLIKQMRAKAKK